MVTRTGSQGCPLPDEYGNATIFGDCRNACRSVTMILPKGVKCLNGFVKRLRLAAGSALCLISATSASAVQAEPGGQNAAPDSIGTATRKPDGTIILQLRGQSGDGTVAEGQFDYPPDHPRYPQIARHVGPIPENGAVAVRPFEQEGRRTAVAANIPPPDRMPAIGLCTATPTAYGTPIGRWAGMCHRGLAHGVGAMRIRIGDENGVFTGQAIAGRAVSGITTLSSGNYFPLAPEAPRPPDGSDAAAVATERAFRNAFEGAAAASRAYSAMGNGASARYYRQLRQKLIDGQPE